MYVQEKNEISIAVFTKYTYVITVGESRPVNSFNFDVSSATFINGASASCASIFCFVTSGSYCSMYMLTVAPEEPVP